MLVVAVASLVAGCYTTGSGYRYNPYRYQQQPSTQGNTYGQRGYQHGWKVYKKPQPGYTYGGVETNPYGPGGSKSYGPGGGKSYGPGGAKSYGPGGGKSYGPGGGNSYGPGGGKNPLNPWRVAN
jgi:hypothetical protein